MSEQDKEEAQTYFFDFWAVVELMGHVKMAGKLTEEEHCGIKMGRLDVPKADGTFVTVFFTGSSVYRITPCSEELARRMSLHGGPQPVSRYELPALPQTTRSGRIDDSYIPGVDDDGGDEDEDELPY